MAEPSGDQQSVSKISSAPGDWVARGCTLTIEPASAGIFQRITCPSKPTEARVVVASCEGDQASPQTGLLWPSRTKSGFLKLLTALLVGDERAFGFGVLFARGEPAT